MFAALGCPVMSLHREHRPGDPGSALVPGQLAWPRKNTALCAPHRVGGYMNQHYYTPADARYHSPGQVRGLDLCFRTDSGVFSKAAWTRHPYPHRTCLPDGPGAGHGLRMGRSGHHGPPEPAILSPHRHQRTGRRAGRKRQSKRSRQRAGCDGRRVRRDGRLFQYITGNPHPRGKAFLYPLFEEALKRLGPGQPVPDIRKQQGADSPEIPVVCRSPLHRKEKGLRTSLRSPPGRRADAVKATKIVPFVHPAAAAPFPILFKEKPRQTTNGAFGSSSPGPQCSAPDVFHESPLVVHSGGIGPAQVAGPQWRT